MVYHVVACLGDCVHITRTYGPNAAAKIALHYSVLFDIIVYMQRQHRAHLDEPWWG